MVLALMSLNFFTKLSRISGFAAIKAKKISKYRFVCFFFLLITSEVSHSLNVSRSHLTHFKVLVEFKSQIVLDSQTKALVTCSHEVSHLPFKTPYFAYVVQPSFKDCFSSDKKINYQSFVPSNTA